MCIRDSVKYIHDVIKSVGLAPCTDSDQKYAMGSLVMKLLLFLVVANTDAVETRYHKFTYYIHNKIFVMMKSTGPYRFDE